MELIDIYSNNDNINNIFQYLSKTIIKNKLLADDNVFNKFFFLENVIDLSLCKKIINEVELINNWNNENDKAIYSFISCESLNKEIFEKILNNIYLQFDKITSLYKLENLQLDVCELIIVKIEKKDVFNNYKRFFLKFMVLLNSENDFNGGEIIFFHNEKTINLKQGSLFIHSNLFNISNNVTNGIMYLLLGYIYPYNITPLLEQTS